jgi:hypothetical protein
MPGTNRGRAMSDKDKKTFLDMQKKKKKTPAKRKARMNRGGEAEMNRGGKAKKKGMARGCGAATKGKSFNK